MKIKVELKGFTPLIDPLVEKYGIVTAAVFWGYLEILPNGEGSL